MTTEFWRDSTGTVWAHLEDMRAGIRRNGSLDPRSWFPNGGTVGMPANGLNDLGPHDALLALGLDRNDIAADIATLSTVKASVPGDEIVVLGHKSGKTFGTGLVELMIVPGSHPQLRPNAPMPNSLAVLARFAGAMDIRGLQTLLRNWHN